ncbi:sarcoglycan alpha isoform X3 [Rhodnius prolixus]|uniref:sarcoglycan alpha isoform X3 n=1 Tax=Rhodnius prolixus TaxID=13249 RepID=UPI003D18C1D5
MMFALAIFWLVGWSTEVFAVEVQTTKLFVLPINPRLFNWTSDDISVHGFWYRGSMLNSPDLPSWMNYIYSVRYNSGYIYGVPPAKQQDITIELIGMNKKNYETRRIVKNINITEKQEPAKYEIQMKIDNLNIDDLFDGQKLQMLMNVFKEVLWSDADDLYATFLDSAIKLGARLPLKPQEGEGVVVHLGSTSEFSQELINLQEEVRPLWKRLSCPRDFKRTTVDRHFRPRGFLPDWCSFRLNKIESDGTDKAQYMERPPFGDTNAAWELPSRIALPTRNYSAEMATTLIVPVVSIILLAVLLSFILCFHHDTIGVKKDDDMTTIDYGALDRDASTLRASSALQMSPRLNGDAADACRPSPPPYTATKRALYDS